MSFLHRPVRVVARVALLPVLIGACGIAPHPTVLSVHATPKPTLMAPTRTHIMSVSPIAAANRAIAIRRWNDTVYINTIVDNAAKAAAEQAAIAHARETATVVVTPPQGTVVVSGSISSSNSLSSVAQCIKSHESGNYTESSHPSSGSGAYQFIPSTWETWSARAGYPGYAYAYQAPPAVQDAVLLYALNNGGAGNWSNRWGNDPCTAGLPGGG